eukprot:TRINITY_DN33713_c0_g1_i1.p1 TRINITY_DN33713_c0_g1~~TRINITY_DN33713_c0_g1_i1.p1  ORF type:complete len:605 (+),score=121.32 TRINITY_DN33713_c0_g1_i1:36-1850(+)
MGYASTGGYLWTAVLRTVTWLLLTNIVLVCRDSEALGGLIAKCTLHETFRHRALAITWLGIVDILVMMQLMCSIHNALCAVQQSKLSNAIAPITAALTFASVGITMGSVGVWWGIIGLPCFILGPGIIVMVKGWSVLTRTFAINMLFRMLHTWDIVTDFATSALIGVESTLGAIYFTLAALNLLMFIVNLYTVLGEDSLLRVVVNVVKAVSLDMPMLVLDGVLLVTEDRPPEERAVIIVSAMSSLFELVGSFKAAIEFHTVSRQHEAMKKGVQLANAVAGALAKFDLDDATKMIADPCPENAELCQAFSTLVENLRLYRPYLPDAMFDDNPQPLAAPSISPDRGHSNDRELDTSDIVVLGADADCLALEPPAIVLTGPPLLPLDLMKRYIAALTIKLNPSVDPVTSEAQDIVSTTNAFLSTVFIEAKSYRGVIHTFDTGYEVVVTFGAAKASKNPASDAYACAGSVLNRLKHEAVHVGISAGPAVIGNLGAGGRLCFAVTGEVISKSRQGCCSAIENSVPLVGCAHFREAVTESPGPWMVPQSIRRFARLPVNNSHVKQSLRPPPSPLLFPSPRVPTPTNQTDENLLRTQESISDPPSPRSGEP